MRKYFLCAADVRTMPVFIGALVVLMLSCETSGAGFRQVGQGHTLQFALPHLNISTEVLRDSVASHGGESSFNLDTKDAESVTGLPSVIFQIGRIRTAQKVPSAQAKQETIYFATYGDASFSHSKERIVREAERTGWFHNSTAFGPESLPSEFKERYSDILRQPRGGGYWIWKFAVFEMMLSEMEEGDFFVYADAGCSVNRESEDYFREYIDMVRSSPYDMISFDLGIPENVYTTDHIFQAFGVGNATDPIRTSGQYMATVLIMQKGPHLRKWLEMCHVVLQSDSWLITDKYNQDAALFDSAFKDNRHDQSILSVSRKLVGSVVVNDTTYPPTSRYPFSATRNRGYLSWVI